MIVLIPLGGIGERFKKFEYTKPKALIEVGGKCIIFHLLDNLNLENIDYVMIPYNKEYENFKLKDLLYDRYPSQKFKFLCLENNTRGAAETINKVLNHFCLHDTVDQPVLCIDSDSFYLSDIISDWNGENAVFTFEDTNEKPIFSYVKSDENNIINEIKEKEKISNFANTGAYGFQSIRELINYSQLVIDKDIRQKNEFYTSVVIDQMIKDKFIFKRKEVLNKNFFSLGTPEQVKEYEHPFIFDLDGTLVDTDDVYTVVWNQIMKKYNLSIDENFFKFFIQGKNDVTFLKGIVPNITNEEILEISQLKDKLFIKLLAESSKDIMIPGVKKFIERNKNRRMCIVTSCNKKSAEFILEKTKLIQYMQFLIAAEDCVLHKPNKEPYQKAIDAFQCGVDSCSIFEDSNSGYKSAKSVGCQSICLIISNKSSENILNCDEYKISHYDHFQLQGNINQGSDVCKLIMESLSSMPIKSVKQDEKNLKTGYICDIKSFTLNLNNRNEKIILKIENTDNELSNVAREINLYSNEVYFYDHLSSLMNVIVPKFYKSLTIENKRAILLENLNDYDGKFNVNLNKDVDALFSVIKNISNMHNYFQFKNQSEIIPSMKNVLKINQIEYYKKIIDKRFQSFLELNNILLHDKDVKLLTCIYNNFDKLIHKSGQFPLNFCHGDLKSPNIFYKIECESKQDFTPIFLDWQYIHLNKGISDIVFLLTESTTFDKDITDMVLKYYLQKSTLYTKLDDLMIDFKTSLCVFPFFVLVWFNSENRDNLLDKVFPINFMKNVLKFYNEYLNEEFFDNL